MPPNKVWFSRSWVTLSDLTLTIFYLWAFSTGCVMDRIRKHLMRRDLLEQTLNIVPFRGGEGKGLHSLRNMISSFLTSWPIYAPSFFSLIHTLASFKYNNMWQICWHIDLFNPLLTQFYLFCPLTTHVKSSTLYGRTVVRSYIQIFSAWWVTTILYDYGATFCELRYYV